MSSAYVAFVAGITDELKRMAMALEIAELANDALPVEHVRYFVTSSGIPTVDVEWGKGLRGRFESTGGGFAVRIRRGEVSVYEGASLEDGVRAAQGG